MIDKGANPFIKDCDGDTGYDFYSLSSSNLINLPKSKSVYFPIVDFKNKTLLGPWQYKTGVFPGKFNRLIGSGGEGYVLEGEWDNKKAAFKCVDVGKQEYIRMMDDALDDMEKKLSEMRTMQGTTGSAIMPLIGHFR